MDKIKVAELSDAYYPSVDGVISVIDNYAKQINKENSCVLCAPKPSEKSDYKEKSGFKVFRCKSMPAPEKYRNALPFLDKKFFKNVMAEKPDIIHAHTPFLMGRAGIKLAKKLGVPLVATLHTQYHRDFERTLGKHNPLNKFMIRFISKLYKKADSVWTVSYASVEFLRMYGYKGEVQVIRNATDYVYPDNAEELVKKVNALHNLKGQKNVFIFVGRMAMYKNLKLLCDAVSLLKKGGEDFKMLFVGGGFDLPELKKYAEEKDILDKCIFTDSVFDRSLLQGYYLRGDLLVFPSTFDMASIVQVEASAHKKAAVVTEGSCSAEQITDGENGFTCKESAESYAEKLAYLCHNGQLVKDVGERAYKTLYRTWDDLGKEVMEKYGQIIEAYNKKHEKK